MAQLTIRVSYRVQSITIWMRYHNMDHIMVAFAIYISWYIYGCTAARWLCIDSLSVEDTELWIFIEGLIIKHIFVTKQIEHWNKTNNIQWIKTRHKQKLKHSSQTTATKKRHIITDQSSAPPFKRTTPFLHVKIDGYHNSFHNPWLQCSTYQLVGGQHRRHQTF